MCRRRRAWISHSMFVLLLKNIWRPALKKGYDVFVDIVLANSPDIRFHVVAALIKIPLSSVIFVMSRSMGRNPQISLMVFTQIWT